MPEFVELSAHEIVAAANGEFPPFQSQKGEFLRQYIESLPIKGLLMELIASAERVDDEWLAWLDQFAVQTFVDDTDFLSLWLHHETNACQHESAKALYTVLKSLINATSQADNNDLSTSINKSAAKSLACYCYFIDDVDEGDKWKSRAVSHESIKDDFNLHLSRIEALHKAKPKVLFIDEIYDIARCCDGNRERILSVLDFLDKNYLHEELISFIRKIGGSMQFHGEYQAYLYFSCLEIVGDLTECFSEIQTYLTQYPNDYPVYAILRSIAHKLDRHDVINVKVSAIQSNKDYSPEALEIIGLDALDQDDYEKARACLKKITNHKNEAYLRLSLACETTIPRARHARRAYQTYRLSNIGHVGPELQYASQLFNDARSERDLNYALSIVEPHTDIGSGNVWYVRLLIQLYVSVSKFNEARAFYDALPHRLRLCRVLKDVRAYFHQQDGDDVACHSQWNTMISDGSYRAMTSQSSPPQPVWFRHDPKSDQILVFVCVYNAMEYVEWFLEHYRQLKVDHFMIIDNGSTDYTDQYLSRQPDVSLFTQPGSFKESAHGVSWINYLIQKYGLDKWCFFVDIDEGFIFSGQSEGQSLKDLLATADEKNQRCFPSYMLDLFATKATAKQPGFKGHKYFDNDYHIFPSIIPPYLRVQGGVRARLTGRQFLITKSPLVKPTRNFRFTENNHTHTHLKPSDSLTAVLHYKFIGRIEERIEEAIDRKQHFMAGRFYKDMQKSISTIGIRRSFASRQFRDTKQLEKLKLLGPVAVRTDNRKKEHSEE